jgi:hypothetical protein
MTGREKEAATAVSSPRMVWTSKTPSGRHVYYGQSGTGMSYTKVVVQPPGHNQSQGDVVTAFISDSIGENVEDLIYVNKSR